MIGARRIITIAGTLCVAIAAGFIAQSALRGNSGKAAMSGVRIASVGSVEAMAPVVENSVPARLDLPKTEAAARGLENLSGKSLIPTPPPAAPQPAALPEVPIRLAALDDRPIIDMPAEQPSPAFGCEIAFSAETMAAAMVKLALFAPCMPNERFTVHHNGLIFATATDAGGKSSLTVPALNEKAVFIATFASGRSAVAQARVDSLEYYDRAVVQWSGAQGPQIHALEYGADYGDAGHVWDGSPRDLSIAAAGKGGFLTRLGDASLPEPRLAEVYTFPAGTALREGKVRLSLEVAVTKGNCGQDITAQALQKSGAKRLRVRELSLAMPGCDAAGDYLVLKNMFDNLSIAHN